MCNFTVKRTNGVPTRAISQIIGLRTLILIHGPNLIASLLWSLFQWYAFLQQNHQLDVPFLDLENFDGQKYPNMDYGMHPVNGINYSQISCNLPKLA